MSQGGPGVPRPVDAQVHPRGGHEAGHIQALVPVLELALWRRCEEVEGGGQGGVEAGSHDGAQRGARLQWPEGSLQDQAVGALDADERT